MNVGIYYFRSLYSQSACSLSVGKFSDFLLNKGYSVKLGILKIDDYSNNRKLINDIIENDVIVYKTNYKDFEYGIRFFYNIKDLYSNKKIFLTGPFANLNSERIMMKYKFVDGIIDMQNTDEIDKNFPNIYKTIEKDTIVSGIDREMEYLEKGSYINLETTTGCIYNCSFCHINILKYPKQVIDVEKLVDEIEILVNKMKKRYLIFNDSIFWKNDEDTERIKDIIKEIQKRNIKFYFMIYLSLTSKIPLDLLYELKSIGLIRVFFGIENISDKFQKNNNKYVSEKDAKEFIGILKRNNISYHIGFILFSYYTTYNELFMNLDFLKDINKLFRPGILVEKMRILPNSKDAQVLYESNEKIDKAYNYKILDNKVEECYWLTCNYFSNINIRYFEHFFSSLDIAICVLRREQKEKYFSREIEYYDKLLSEVNVRIYDILLNMFKNMQYTAEDKNILLDLYSKAEMMYILFTSKLSKTCNNIYMMLPHGKEDLNI